MEGIGILLEIKGRRNWNVDLNQRRKELVFENHGTSDIWKM